MTDFKPFTYVLGRDNETDVWVPDIFSKYYDKSILHPYVCFKSSWRYCIPYKGNEHLAFTTDNTYSPEVGDIVLFPNDHKEVIVGIIIRTGSKNAVVVPRNGDCVFYTRAISELKPFKAEL